MKYDEYSNQLIDMMTQTERNSTYALALIFSFRMLGLFMVLPVFITYGQRFHFATPTLIGLALGIYGLMQALLQIPFGLLSDKIGRKPIILMGLLLFAIGSIVAALSTSIYGVIIGRALQGAGAVGSSIIALLADLTSEEHRTKAMALIGLSIGFSFILAMILGPILGAIFHLNGLFWLTAILALIGIAILYLLVPNPIKSVFHRDTETLPALFNTVLKDKELLRLDFGIFSLHAILTASFIAIPLVLQQIIGIHESQQWILYVPVLILAFLAMLPMIIVAEKQRKMRSLFLIGIGLIILSQLALVFFHHQLITIGISLFIFFTAFTFLEASLPSLISKRAAAGSKGTAMGIYSSSQFLGIFVGGLLGGWIFSEFGFSDLFLACTLLAMLWLVFAFSMQEPRYLATRSVSIGSISAEEAERIRIKLAAIPGVAEVLVLADEGIAHLKVDSRQLAADALTEFNQ